MRGHYGTVLSLLACLCCASALDCYICNSLTDRGCDSTIVSKEYLLNCSVGRNSGASTSAFPPVPKAKVCWKQRQDVFGTIIVDRVCGDQLDDDTSPNSCYDRIGTNKIKVRYCVCNRGGCNGSATLAASAPFVLLLMMLAGFFLGSTRY